jgi:hypothetical protein
MDGASLARARWRLRGAWQWPAFVALTIADAFVGHALPQSGDTESYAAAALAGLVLNLLGVLLLSRPLGALIRRIRRDLPAVVARDYAGTYVVVAITLAILGAGLNHRASVNASRQAMQEATARAQAWIGDHAPPAFRRHIEHVDVLPIQSGAVYRACVPGTHARTYCVVVNLRRPWRRSVRFAGYEPNASFGQGIG